MTPAAPSPTISILAPLSAVAVFALILDHLVEAVGARVGFRPWTRPMVDYLQARLRRISLRFARLAARIQAGKPLPGRARPPRPATDPARDSARDSALEPASRPRPTPPPVRDWFALARFGWLRDMVPSAPGMYGAAGCGTQLGYLLTDPEMVALLAATPRMARLLRPLCWMLGVEVALLSPPPAVAAAGANTGAKTAAAANENVGNSKFYPGKFAPPDEDPGG